MEKCDKCWREAEYPYEDIWLCTDCYVETVESEEK